MKLTKQRMLEIIREEIKTRYNLIIEETDLDAWNDCASREAPTGSTTQVEDPPGSKEWRVETFREKQERVTRLCGERPIAGAEDRDGMEAASVRTGQLDPELIDTTATAADVLAPGVEVPVPIDTASFDEVKKWIKANSGKMTGSQMYWLYALNNLRMYTKESMYYPKLMGKKGSGWLLEISPEIDKTIEAFNKIFTNKFPPADSPKMGYNFPAEIGTAEEFLMQPLNTIRFLNSSGNSKAEEPLQPNGILVTGMYPTLLPKQKQLTEKFEIVVGYIGLAQNDFWVPRSFIEKENQAVLQFIQLNAQQFENVAKPVEMCCREMEVMMNAIGMRPAGLAGPFRMEAFGHSNSVKIWKIIHNYASKDLTLKGFPSPTGQPNGLIALILGYEIYKNEIPWSEWVDYMVTGGLLYLRFGPWVPDGAVRPALASDPWARRQLAKFTGKSKNTVMKLFMYMRNQHMGGSAAAKVASLSEKAKARRWVTRLGRGAVKWVAVPEAAEGAVKQAINRNETYSQYRVLGEQFYSGAYIPMAFYNDLLAASTKDTAEGGETTKEIMMSCAAAVLKVIESKGQISKAGILLNLDKMITGANAPIAAGYGNKVMTGCTIPDDLAAAALRKIPGIGGWSADMWGWWNTWKNGGKIPPDIKEKFEQSEKAVKDAAKNYKPTQDPLKGLKDPSDDK